MGVVGILYLPPSGVKVFYRRIARWHLEKIKGALDGKRRIPEKVQAKID
jgi:hypothetical protein